MSELTLNAFIFYFGGYDKVVVEEQSEINKVYWSGTVDDWVVNPVEQLGNRSVQTANVISDKLYVRVFANFDT